VLDFCAKADNLKRHQYVSTCYVSGRYAGIFTEDDLDKNQPFNNFYEETKHLAEREVRARMGEIPTTIYRPSVVAGDAPTGATQKYDGPYFILRWLLKQPGNVALVPMVGDPTAVRFNVVPRDFVVDALTYLSGEEKSAGQCYALADPAPMTVEEIIGAMETATGKRLIRIPLTVDIAKAAIDYVPGVQKLLGIPSSAVDYFVHPTHYLTTNASRDLAGSGLSVPPFASYLDNMVAFVRANPTISSDAMI
jgi:nucleoside-diphosphate-sugar epimerase